MQIRPGLSPQHLTSLDKSPAADAATTKGAQAGAVQEADKAEKAKKGRGKKAGGEDDEAELEAQGLAPDGSPLLAGDGEVAGGNVSANPVMPAESAYELAAGARDRGLAAQKIIGR